MMNRELRLTLPPRITDTTRAEFWKPIAQTAVRNSGSPNELTQEQGDKSPTAYKYEPKATRFFPSSATNSPKQGIQSRTVDVNF